MYEICTRDIVREIFIDLSVGRYHHVAHVIIDYTVKWHMWYLNYKWVAYVIMDIYCQFRARDNGRYCELYIFRLKDIYFLFYFYWTIIWVKMCWYLYARRPELWFHCSTSMIGAVYWYLKLFIVWTADV